MPEPEILLEASTENTDGVGRVHLGGQLDRFAAAIVIPAVQSLVSEGVTTIEIDTDEVHSADTDGIAALVGARREAVDAGADFVLLSPPSNAVKQEIERTRRALRQPEETPLGDRPTRD